MSTPETPTHEAQPSLRSYHSGQFITCGPCHLIIPSKGNPLAAFLWGKGPVCHSCNKPVDVWSSVLEHLKIFGSIGHIPLGPITTIIQFEVPRNGKTTIDLSSHGIPAGARILDRSYCGHDMSGVSSLEVHGSSPVLGGVHEGKITVYGAGILPRDESHISDVAKQSLSVVWVPKEFDKDGWRSLWSAFEAFARHDHQGVIVPANVAVELIADRLVWSYMETVPGISGENLKGFFDDVTYSRRLNVFVPLLAHVSGAPALGADIRGALNALRNFRNDVGHRGKTKRELDRAETARLLCAAIFGFHYMSMLWLHVLGKPIYGVTSDSAGSPEGTDVAEVKSGSAEAIQAESEASVGGSEGILRAPGSRAVICPSRGPMRQTLVGASSWRESRSSVGGRAGQGERILCLSNPCLQHFPGTLCFTPLEGTTSPRPVLTGEPSAASISGAHASA